MPRLKQAEIQKLREAIKRLREGYPPVTFEDIAKILHIGGKQMARYHYQKVIHNRDLQGTEK